MEVRPAFGMPFFNTLTPFDSTKITELGASSRVSAPRSVATERFAVAAQLCLSTTHSHMHAFRCASWQARPRKRGNASEGQIDFEHDAAPAAEAACC